jgi:hypothetical protein
MANYIESYFDPTFRVEYQPDREGRNIRATRAAVNEYDTAFKAAAEQKAGRPLSSNEVRHGVKPHEDRSHQTQYDDSQWEPKKTAPASGSVYDRLLAEANVKDIDTKLMPDRSPGTKRLDTRLTPDAFKDRLRTGNRELDADAATAEAEREWRADPFRVRAIAELDELQKSIRYDTTRVASEIEAIRKARASLETVGSDTSESRRLLNIVFQHEAKREQTIRQSAEADIAAAQSRLANLKTGQRPAKVAPPQGSNLNERLHNLFNAVNQAGGTSRDLDVISEARESGDRARQEWVLNEYSEQPTPAEPSTVVVTEVASE